MSSIEPKPKPARIEETKRRTYEEEREKEEGQPPSDPLNLTGILAVLFDKVLFTLNHLIQKNLARGQEKPARETLYSIKASFEILMQEDRSQDAAFLSQLSDLWQSLLEHAIQTNTPWAKGMIQLIKEIDSQPEEEEHTLGYYLEQCAGQKWLPFPYMDLIQKIHHDYRMSPSSSLLTRWVRMIEEILSQE
ncbi:MAG TPA: hypothetical protein VLE95_03395 [Chlamydiales bacterium]|nr:hypothetical protein [Chlamydiales bacterium]